MFPKTSSSISRRAFVKAASLAGGAAYGASVRSATPPGERKFLGITVMPEFLQTEGIDRVLENLAAAGATAVATSPYVMEPAEEGQGSREPPDDAGSAKVRLLDRPLWGKRELFVRTAPSFAPDLKLYRGLKYQPPEPSELTRRQGALVQDFIRAARARKLKVYFQVQAAIPPGYRVQFGGPQDDDRARLPDGRIPPRRLSRNGSLASVHIRAYTQALVRDLCLAYPEIQGIRLDWPEYPPYFLDDVFLDFSEHAQSAARQLGYDFTRMRKQVGAVYATLHGGLRSDALAPWTEPDGGRYRLLRLLARHPGIGDFFQFKAELVDGLLGECRRALTEAGGPEKELMPNAFPPPFTLFSGMDFTRAARHSSAVSVKLYTMHWPMILRSYGDVLLASNPGLSETKLVRALVKCLDIADDEGLPHLSHYRYPEPEEPHPVGVGAQVRKIAQAQAESGAVPVYPIAHGYGPVDDFRKRLRAAWEAGPYGIWINRYAYLSDKKLEVIREVCQN